MSKSKDRIKQTGEVFTPSKLVNEMLDKIPTELINDPDKTIIDPSCGNGQFLIEVVKRRGTIKNVFGVDIMADNCCDTIARLIFYAVHGLEIINENAQFVSDLDHDGHTDHPMYPFAVDIKKFFRYYSYQNKEVIVMIDHASETGVWFKYSTDGGQTYTVYPYIVCADSLQFNYDEFDMIEHLDIACTPVETSIIVNIEPIKKPKIEEPPVSVIKKPKVKDNTNKDYEEFQRLESLKGTTEFNFAKWDKLRKKFSS